MLKTLLLARGLCVATLLCTAATPYAAPGGPAPAPLPSNFYQPRVDFATGTLPYYVAIGDLDGDGKADMVSANTNSGSFSVYRNTSSPGSITAASFAARVDFPTGASPVSVAIGDVDGDGKPDITVANQDAASVSVYRNTSNPGSLTAASFAAPLAFSTGAQPYSVVLSDVDGDGKPDIITANAASNTISILRNTASAGSLNLGSIQSRIDFNTGANPRFVAAGDVDGDGKADLVVANELNATVSVYRNTASAGVINAASLSAPVSFATGAHPLSVVIGNLDNDSRPDLAVANYESNTISVFHNNGSAGSLTASSFSPKVDFATSPQPFSLALGDVDADGKRDIVIANSVSSGMSVLHNAMPTPDISSSSFDASQQFATGGYPLAVALGDLDGDGTPEVVTANGANTLSVFKAAAVVLVPASRPVISSINPSAAPAGSPVTITGTGFNPVPAANTVFFGGVKGTVTGGSASSLTVTVPTGSFYQPPVVLNTANGLSGAAPSAFLTTFNSPIGTTLYSTSYVQATDLPTGAVPYAAAFADFNGDGKPDMAIVNSSDNTVSITQNNTNPGGISAASFSAPVVLPAGGDPRAIAAADVDGDGKPDIVIANLGSANVWVYRNISGSGTITPASFASPVQFSTGNQPFSVAIGDLDGDGKPDLVTSNLTDNTLSLLHNTGSAGTLTPASFSRVDFPTAGSPRFVAVGDLDGDGKADLAVANQQSSSVSVWQNIAIPGKLDATSFAARTDFTTRSGPQYIAIGDINGDSKPELVVACFGSRGISALRNTSTPGSLNSSSFAAQTPLVTDGDFFALALGDANGDGIADIISPKLGYFSQNTLVIWTNPLNSSISRTVSFPINGYLIGSYVVDLDGDGGPELGTLSASDNRINFLKLSAAVSVPVPTITALTPSKGAVGSSVVITGANFESNIANNTVYFGSVKAPVTAATSTSLTVTVPAGITYEPVSVLNTTSSLIGYSPAPFSTTFANPRPAFDGNFYQTRRDFPLPGHFPYGVALGDIDGDGKPDLVVANSDNGYISAQQNKSTTGRIDANSFGSQTTFFAGNPFNVILRDLDRDGKLDAIAVNLNNSSVNVYRNTASPGTISFAAPLTFGQSGNSLSYSLAAGDLDNDGRTDIVFVNATNNVVSILRNQSAAGVLDPVSFATKVDLPTGRFPRYVALTDIDGDGKTDILVANQNDNTVSVFRNLGTQSTITTASFAPRVDFATGAEPGGLATGDLDGDGKPDVAVINHGSNTVSVFRNLAASGSITAGSLAAKVDFATGAEPYALTVTDANGDGKADLLVANAAAGNVSALRNTATTGAIDASSFAGKVDFAGAGYLISLAAGDVDGDGIPEILTGNASSNPNAVSVMSVDAPEAALPSAAPVITSFTPQNAKPGTALTISGSNFNAAAASNTVYFGSVKAQVTAAGTNSLTVTVPAGSIYQRLSVLNTDNGLVGYSIQPFLATFTNPAAGFAPRADFTVGSSPRAVAVGDLDGDGKPDLVVANQNSPTVSVIRNTTTSGALTAASMAAKVDLPLNSNAFTVEVGDIDGDGKLDVIASSNNAVSVFRNISTQGLLTSASFAPRADFSVGSGPLSIAVADLDQDGKTDLAISNNGSSTISLLHNIGTPGSITSATFEPKFELASYRSGYIAVADMDGDGKPDLVQSYVTGASRYDGSIAVYRNQTVRGFLNVNSFAGAATFYASNINGYFSLFDADGDAKPDVVFSSPGNVTKVGMLRNTSTPGNLSMVDAQGLPGDDGMAGHAVGDLNGDGKPDLIITNNANLIIYGYTNKATPGVLGYQSFNYGPNLQGSGGPAAAAIADLDGDGYPEVVTTNNNTTTISIYRMNPPASAAMSQTGKALATESGSSAPAMQVFPNPARDEFSLALSGLNVSSGSIEILNEGGKRVSSRQLNISGRTGSFVVRLSLKDQPAGVYYVKVVTTGGIQIAKVVVQR